MSQTNENRPSSSHEPATAAEVSRAGNLSETIAPNETARGLGEETVNFSGHIDPLPAQTVDFVPEISGFSRTIDSLPSRSSGTKSGGSAPPPQVQGYTVLSELGRGGMGVVYKAKQIKLNRIIALKMVLAGAHAGQDQLDRF